MARVGLVSALVLWSFGCASAPPTSSAPSEANVSRASVTPKPPPKAGPFAWEGEALISGADRDKRIETDCPWLASAIMSAKANPKLHGEALVPHLKIVAAEHGKNGEQCLDLLREGMRSYRDDMIRAEAKSALRVFARTIRDADTACLASTPPVPASLDAFASANVYESSASEWSAPAWQCLAWRMETPQRYRYAVYVDDAKTEFVAVAERGDGSEVLFVRGPVRGKDEPVVMTRRK